MRGRPRKPTAQLKMTGDFRKDRHGDREDEYLVSGKPRKPAELQGEAARCWGWLVGATPPGVFGQQDLPLLIQWCRCWESYCAAWEAGDMEKAERCIDKQIRLAGKLGVGPVERTRVKANPNDKPKDAFGAWESKVG